MKERRSRIDQELGPPDACLMALKNNCIFFYCILHFILNCLLYLYLNYVYCFFPFVFGCVVVYCIFELNVCIVLMHCICVRFLCKLFVYCIVSLCIVFVP